MHGLNCCPPDEFRSTINDIFPQLLIIQIMIQNIEIILTIQNIVSNLSHTLKIISTYSWYSCDTIIDRYTHTHFSTHTGSKAKGRRGSLALPISSIWNTGERRAEHEWNKVEQRGKARENVRGERSGPDKAGPRQGYAGAAVSRSA